MLAQRVAQRFGSLGYHVRREVPYLSRSVDMVFLGSDAEPVAVEFKLRDWQRAIKQAAFCLTGAAKAYICMPAQRVGETVVQAAKDRGVGVLVFHNEEGGFRCEERLPAPHSECLWPVGKAWLLRAFEQAPPEEAP